MKTFSFYLPQFHPDKMNDLFWEKNFTDWVTTKSAQKLFRGHKQPFFPSDLGCYDLRDVEVLRKQSKMAKDYGIDGFAFYHYIFNSDTKALESPVNNLRENPDIDINYFLCWVNADWTKAWIGDDYTFLYKQSYDCKTIETVIQNACWHFKDDRYYKIDGKPLFYIHDPEKLDVSEFKRKFMKISTQLGFSNVLFAAPELHTPKVNQAQFNYLFGYPPGDFGFFSLRLHILLRRLMDRFKFQKYEKLFFPLFSSFNYKKYIKTYSSYIHNKSRNKNYIPTILSGWDNTPRYSHRGFIFNNFNPESFYRLSYLALKACKNYDKHFLMIKAWNEWAEGNVLEPSEIYGNSILKSFKKAKENLNLFN